MFRFGEPSIRLLNYGSSDPHAGSEGPSNRCFGIKPESDTRRFAGAHRPLSADGRIKGLRDLALEDSSGSTAPDCGANTNPAEVLNLTCTGPLLGQLRVSTPSAGTDLPAKIMARARKKKCKRNCKDKSDFQIVPHRVWFSQLPLRNQETKG